jgi:hypothetical protein
VTRNANAPAGNRGAGKTAFRSRTQPQNTTLRGLLARLDDELAVVELAAWAAFHGDPLEKVDLDRTLLAIRRLEAIREAVNARL